MDFNINQLGKLKLVCEWHRMLEALVEVSSIYDWHKAFSLAPAEIEDTEIALYVKEQWRTYQLPLPATENSILLDITARYIAVFLNNRIVTQSAEEFQIKTKNKKLIALVENYLDSEYGYGDIYKNIREVMKTYNNLNRFSPTYSSNYKARKYERDSQTMIAINIGQTKLKISAVKICPNRCPVLIAGPFFYWTWEKDKSKSIEALFGRILNKIKELIILNKIEASCIGIGIAARAKNGFPMSLPVGITKHFDSKNLMTWGNMNYFFSNSLEGIPCFVENDAAAKATFYSRLYEAGELLLVRFGSTLCAGYIDKTLSIPNGYNEFSRLIIDFWDSTDAKLYYQRRAGNYLSYQGINHIIRKNKLFYSNDLSSINNEGDLPQKLPKLLEHGTPQQKAEARIVYQEVGRYLANYIYDLCIDYKIRKVVIEGSVVEGKPEQEIREAALQELERMGLSSYVQLIFPDKDYSKISGFFGLAYLAEKYIGTSREVQLKN